MLAQALTGWVAGAAAGIGASLVAGLVLWAFLPHGAVLTWQARTGHDRQGRDILDTWEVKNPSSSPIQVRSVLISGASFVSDDGELLDVELQTFDEGPARLVFDDHALDVARQEQQQPWSGVTIPPGATLAAHVPNNCSLTIHYRRAGLSGIFERRTITIHGHV